jgi:hypothetical protein
MLRLPEKIREARFLSSPDRGIGDEGNAQRRDITAARVTYSSAIRNLGPFDALGTRRTSSHYR